MSYSINGSRKRRYEDTGDKRVLVSGIPATTTRQEFTRFVNGNSNRASWIRLVFRGGHECATIICAPEEVNNFLQLDSMKFNGSTISTKLLRGSGTYAMPSQILTPEQIKQVQLVVQGRIRNKVVDVSGLVTGASKTRWVNFNSPMFCQELFKAIKVQLPDCVGINFGKNKIKYLRNFKELGVYLPNISSLCFANNEIEGFEQFQNFSSFAAKITELVESSTNHEDSLWSKAGCRELYVWKLKKWLPNLRRVNGKKVESVINFEVSPQAQALFDIEKIVKPGTLITNQVIKKFVSQYLTAFDTNREDLLEVYDKDALLSITFIPTIRGWVPRTTTPTSDDIYRSHDCNELLPNPCKPKKGRIDIVSTINNLPNSKHSQDFLVADGMQLDDKSCGSLFKLNLTGIFNDTSEAKRLKADKNAQSLRRFSTVLLIKPNKTDTVPFKIVNHQMYIGGITTPVSPKGSPDWFKALYESKT